VEGVGALKMDHTTIIGSVAALFTTIAYIPQAIKVHKTRHTRDLSIWMLGILTTGIFLWTLYGVFLMDKILILANSISFVISAYILFMKAKHG
jgi:MtN3 and saliva related transmembrane protein